MKNLGLLLGLIATTSLAFGEISNQKPVPKPLATEIKLAMSEHLIQVQPQIKVSTESKELDTTALLNQVNARLEQAMEAKFDALLAAQLEALNEQ